MKSYVLEEFRMRPKIDKKVVADLLLVLCMQAGRISVVGVYSGFTNGLNIGVPPISSCMLKLTLLLNPGFAPASFT